MFSSSFFSLSPFLGYDGANWVVDSHFGEWWQVKETVVVLSVSSVWVEVLERG
jgi:hypothetical protein